MDIFAGSLPFKLNEEDLKKLFETYGEVTSAKIIIDKITRQNKGFAFIEMPNDEEAMKAIEALHGSEVMGRQIVVNKSEKKENRGDSTRSNEKRTDFNKSSSSNNSGGSNSNFGANKVKGGGYGNNKGGYGNNKGGGFNKGKSGGFNKGNKRDNYRGDENNY